MDQGLRDLIDRTFANNPRKREAALAFFEKEMIDTIDEARGMSQKAWDTMVEGLSVPLRAALGLTKEDKPYSTMKLSELLEALAIGDRDPGLLQELRSKGAGILLVDKQGSLRVSETVRALGAPHRPVSGSLWGPEALRVISFSEYIAEQVEYEPLSLHPLVEGFDNATGLDWSGVPKEVRLFLRFAVNFGAKRDPHDMMDDLAQAENQLTKLAQQPRWTRQYESYQVAKRRDFELEARLMTDLYPPKGVRNEPPLSVCDFVEPPPKPSAPLRPVPSRLSGALWKELSTALLQAFPTQSDYNRLVREGLGVNPETISSSEQSLSSRIFGLIEYCEARSAVARLLQVAENQNGDAPLLRALLDRYPVQVAQSASWDADRVRRFRKALAYLYPDTGRIRRVVSEVGVSGSEITWGGSVTDVWHSVLVEAERASEGGLDRLLEVARNEYPNNPAIRAV